jgi:uncharacterized protein (UPF0548 family)
MFCLRRPADEELRRWLAAEDAVPLPGAPAERCSTRDHQRVVLGEGRECFQRACAALRRWEPFRLGWAEAFPPDAPIRVGTTVGVVVRHFGVWSLAPSRIVAVTEDGERFGFVYRTLPDHALEGEERFLVEWRQSDGAVAYERAARSRPRHVLVWLGFPLARLLQRRFARDSAAAMRRAVSPLRGAGRAG